jgi:hypothetical protein
MDQLFQKKLPYERKGLQLKSELYWHTKDPCPVFDGTTWHLYGSGGEPNVEIWKILHATAPSPEGPWTEQTSALLDVVRGPHVAAPGVIYDPYDRQFHMFVQREFMRLGGTIEHLTSADGNRFNFSDTALSSLDGTAEAGIYDPHPAFILGKRWLVYSGMKEVARPDLFVAESPTAAWDGAWQRRGKIVSHEHIIHHNQHDHTDYEWGLEGSQLIELPSGNILLNAVCFLPSGRRGERQRVFFAAARTPLGPYITLGPVIEPYGTDWESGENGHAAGIIVGDALYLYYQSRAFSERHRWCYGLAVFKIKDIENVVEGALREKEL